MLDLYFKLEEDNPHHDLLQSFLSKPEENLEETLRQLFQRYPGINNLTFESSYYLRQNNPSYSSEFIISEINSTRLHTKLSSLEWAGKFFQEDFLNEEEKSLLIDLNLSFKDLCFFLNFLFVIRDHHCITKSDVLIATIKKILPRSLHIDNVSRIAIF